MADIDEILVCPECLHPVDKLVLCPDCNKPVEEMPSLLLPTLRILRAKGWIVEGWDSKESNLAGAGMAFGIYPAQAEISFYRFAPPLVPWVGMSPQLRGDFAVVLSEGKSQAVAIADGKSPADVYISLYKWAKDAPCFAIPFAQDICDICRGQAIIWFFSECVCASGRGIHRRHAFADGIPEECIYADAQVVTMENRFNQLEKFFEKNPITRRKAARQLPKQS
jgi:hypothetical protein